MDNSTYHHEFITLIDTIKTYGGTGAIGITPTFVSQMLWEMQAKRKCMDPTTPTMAKLVVAHKKVRD